MKKKQNNRPFADAAVVWHLQNLQDSSGNSNNLEISRQGCNFVKLAGKDLAASLKRGGNGYAARFKNASWLSSQDQSKNILQYSKAGMTISIRIKTSAPGGVFYTNIFSLNIHNNGLLVGWLGLRLGGEKWYTQIPLGKIELKKWYDLIFRFKPGKLEIFANGALMDTIKIGPEPYPVSTGATMVGGWKIQNLAFKAFPDHVEEGIYSSLFTGLIDHVAFWNRAISDDEIASLSAVKKLKRDVAKSASRQCLKDYQQFHEASITKDVKKCEKIGMAMRKFMTKDQTRPIYHLTAPVGWILDPAGAFFHKGQYHVYSYRNIFSMLTCNSLDHYVSDDMIHWRDLPIGVWADSDLDVHGIWLANNFIDDQGVPSMIYTAHGLKGKIGVLARSRDNLVSFKAKKPVITEIMHHDGHTWKDGDTWYTITTRQYFGKRPGNKGDSVIILSSPDLENWTERGELFSVKKFKNPKDDHQKWGFTEFPYLIPFGKKFVFMTGTHPVMYWVGKFDRKKLKFIPDHPEGKLLDYLNPFHCFNPMTVDDKGPGGKKRRIIFAMYPFINGSVDAIPWNGIHVLPRVLTLDGDYLKQEPVPEAQSLRGKQFSLKNMKIKPSKKDYITKVKGDALEIIAEFAPGTAKKFGLKVRMSDDGRKSTSIGCDVSSGKFFVKGNINIRAPYPGLGTGPLLPATDGKSKIHVFLDKSCFEVFINGLTCSGSFKTDQENTGLDLFSEGGTVELKSLNIWQMKSPWN